jgi:predicted tellurium resistance membrane protein TerC
LLNNITTVLELAGAVLVLVALALVAHALAPEPYSLPAALAVGGLGLVGISFVIAPRRTRRKVNR